MKKFKLLLVVVLISSNLVACSVVAGIGSAYDGGSGVGIGVSAY